jgi:hypothetical protein
LPFIFLIGMKLDQLKDSIRENTNIMYEMGVGSVPSTVKKFDFLPFDLKIFRLGALVHPDFTIIYIAFWRYIPVIDRNN